VYLSNRSAGLFVPFPFASSSSSLYLHPHALQVVFDQSKVSGPKESKIESKNENGNSLSHLLSGGNLNHLRPCLTEHCLRINANKATESLICVQRPCNNRMEVLSISEIGKEARAQNG